MSIFKNYCICLILLVAFLSSGMAQQEQLNGVVRDSISGSLLTGVTIRTDSYTTVTNEDGQFSIHYLSAHPLIINAVGYQSKEIKDVAPGQHLDILLVPEISVLEEVEVIHSGYQQLPRERATGSFNVIKSDLLNRSVSPDLLSRLENLSPGLLFNRGDAASTDRFLIRGRSTITAEAQPLIVVDNFPYDGDLNNLNPNTIEQVTILKDAAAASIWGARASNGVVVITTKKGSTLRPQVSFGANLSLQGRPDLFNVSMVSSADRVDWERKLYESGYYDAAKEPTTLLRRVSPLPEAVELMIANPDDLEILLDTLRHHDVRNDLQQYFYQQAVNQQYNLSISGRQQRLTYAISGGYDQNVATLVGQEFSRFNLRTNTAYQVSERLQAEASIAFTKSSDNQGNNPGIGLGGSTGLSPYARLVDGFGDPLPYYQDYRKGFVDTAGNGEFLDWRYRPLEEIRLRRAENQLIDYVIQTGVSYRIAMGLSGQFKYQYQYQLQSIDDLHREGSYYARNQVNIFTQVDPVTGAAEYPVPMGGIMNLSRESVDGHQGRLQLNYAKEWAQKHRINSLVGYEIRSLLTEGNQFMYYGYTDAYTAVNGSMDFLSYYPRNTSTSSTRLNNPQQRRRLTDHFLSWYANVSYTYDGRYLATASVRKDEANLFGVAANQKGTPLWSAGIAWHVDKEPFYNVDWLSLLRLRLTYGVNGNISRRGSAYTIAQFRSGGGQSHSFPTADVISPPNESLRWERTKVWNAGVDFSLRNQRLSGTIEWYRKAATDLLAEVPTDPTRGVTSVFSNAANMVGEGLDVQLNSINFRGAFGWQTAFIYSYNTTKVTKYLMPLADRGIGYAEKSATVMPVIGNPVYGIYSYEWAGLDPQNGSPRIILNGEISDDYNALVNAPLDAFSYNGPVQPVHFGAIRNTFTWKAWELSCNISFKAGYYFRSHSMINGGLIAGWTGHGDYQYRWQQAGDEVKTHVPAVIYPANVNRDRVYQYSSVLVQRADHVRLEDINLSYRLSQADGTRLPFQSIRVFLYLSNMGLIWAANTKNIDPYFNNQPMDAKHISIGLNIDF